MLRLNPGELGVQGFNENTVVLYPNPTTGVCTLQLQEPVEKGMLHVYNVLGQEVDCLVVPPRNDSSVKLDLSGYPSGVYIVEVKTGNGVLRKKVIKE